MDKHMVRDSSGAVDVLASATAYVEALTLWCAEHEIDPTLIESAVEAVFDRHDGKRLPVPALLSFAVTELGATPEQHKVLTERVRAYVKGQTALGRLEIGKGKAGGCSRRFKPEAK